MLKTPISHVPKQIGIYDSDIILPNMPAVHKKAEIYDSKITPRQK